MALGASNTVFFYRDGDPDSLAVAEYYRDSRGLPADQIVPIVCSDIEILNSYDLFRAEVELPIFNSLNSAPLNARDIYVLILGYNVPGGFYEPGIPPVPPEPSSSSSSSSTGPIESSSSITSSSSSAVAGSSSSSAAAGSSSSSGGCIGDKEVTGDLNEPEAIGCYDEAGTIDGKDYFAGGGTPQWFIVFNSGADAWFISTNTTDPDTVGRYWMGDDPPGTNASPNGTYNPGGTATGVATVTDGALPLIVDPGSGFTSSGDIISSVSRIMRINAPLLPDEENYFYGHKTSTLFQDGDEDYAYVVSRIDAPSVALAEEMIDKAAEIENQGVINGKFFLDPFFGISSNSYLTYQNNLLTFAAHTFPNLHLPLVMTNLEDPYVDTVFACIEQDSFYWGGIADYANNIFYGTDTSRMFFYNTDTNPALTVRTLIENYWVVDALNNGYAAAAGAMSSMIPSRFLDATVFFETLLTQHGTIGEAFLFASHYVQTPLTFIGDPLTTVVFPASNRDPSGVPNLYCSFFGGEKAPYQMTLDFSDIEISDDCLTDPSTGDRFYVSSVNADINWIHSVSWVSNCRWETTIPKAVTTVRWFAPITESDPCSNLPSTSFDGEVVEHDLIVSAEIQKVLSSDKSYYLTIKIQSSDGNITFFEGGNYYTLGQDLKGFVLENINNTASIDGNTIIIGIGGDIDLNDTYFIGDIEGYAFEPTEADIWLQTSIELAKAVANFNEKTELTAEAFYKITLSMDIPTEVDMLYPSQRLAIGNNTDRRKSWFYAMTEYLLTYGKQRFIEDYLKVNPDENKNILTMNEFLGMEGYKISEQLLDVLGEDREEIEEKYIYPEGFWTYETPLADAAAAVAYYYFELDVATDTDFNNIIFSFDSAANRVGWRYQTGIDEDGQPIFDIVPLSGVPYSEIGSMIKFESPEQYYLDRNVIYYYRFRQKTNTTNYPYTTWNGVIYT